MDKSNIVSWILFIPGAFLTQAGIVFAFSYLLLLFGIKNQLVFDGISAFLGNFLFLLAINLYVPLKKEAITKIFFILLLLFSIFGFFSSLFGLYSLVGMKTPALIIPILQFLGIILSTILIKSLG